MVARNNNSGWCPFCEDFEFNPMDAFFENERGYKPRTDKPKPDCEQITFEDLL